MRVEILIHMIRPMVILIFHISLPAFGFLMSMLLLVAIFRGTSKTIKNYSVLLFWCAFNDLVAIVSEFMGMERLAILPPSLVLIATGPCTLISADFCNYCDSFFCGTIIQSVIIQCISFWYRLRILSKPPPGAIILNLIVLVFAIPNIVHMIFFKYMKTVYDEPTLLKVVQTLYPQTNWTGTFLYGLSDLFDPPQSVALFYYYAIIPILVAFLIFFRSRAVNLLTIHSLLPMIICIACASHILLILGVYNPEIEAFTFLIAMIPPILNPGITIWFIKPYKAYVTRILFGNHFKRIFTVGSTSNASGSRVSVIEKNGKTVTQQKQIDVYI
ncbi:hypothetical protein PRIPAC_95595 [Pristionchus pacificus]|uniref:G protein-coupled receptor n=1 Tax=Pristionchus pacificus TaxID=54126 RepID=A0A2A6D293_PRIPA|nr:hypothetical protein PRIPAC_95595 [Pristionchus pacificus]|eukprot:PDM84427.1 G protein-coupled receptor [Pristionchus pacificus]